MDSSLILIFVNAGVAGVIAVLFITGLIYPRSVVQDKDKRIALLETTVAAERQRGDAAVAAASASRDVLVAFQAGRQTIPAPGTGPPP